ncbi:F-box domain containing protein [Tanacetum coccineum]
MESRTISDCKVDRLSNLPDDLIYKILSYVDILYSIRLSVLSSRWRFIQTSMPNLNFSSDQLLSKQPSRYHEFVNDVLSTRNNKIDVSSVSLHFPPENHDLSVLRILEYSFSHNVQQLSIRSGYFEFSPSHSSLAMCHNLKNITLEECQVFEPEDADGFSDGFSISSYFPKLSLDGFPSLEKVDLCISSPQKTNVHRIFDLFQRLHNVKSLALSLEIVELLSTSEEVISHQPSLFPSLKSLKIYPSKGFKDSSNATFTMVSHEEARAIKITTLAYCLMAALWKILDKIEAYTDTKRANVEWKKTLADDSCREGFVI